MSVSSKSPMLRWLFPLALCSVVLAAGGHEPRLAVSTEGLMEQTQAAALSASDTQIGRELVSAPDSAFPRLLAANHTQAAPARAKVPFCLPGEKVVCTLGPPPVCSCQ